MPLSIFPCPAHTVHMPKPVITFVFKVLRNGLLRYILYTCSKAQTCDNVRVQSATQWTAAVHTLYMPKPVITFVFKVLPNGLSGTYFTLPKSEFSRSKKQLRRIGKLGRMSPKTSHIHVLAVRRLLEKPGLATCIAALARYRKSRAGQLGHAPGDEYDITKDKESLFD